jgi:hypothetical protein
MHAFRCAATPTLSFFSGNGYNEIALWMGLLLPSHWFAEAVIKSAKTPYPLGAIRQMPSAFARHLGSTGYTCRIASKPPASNNKMSDDYAFFEYRAKITNMGHAEDNGEHVHCFIEMKIADATGKRLRNLELEQQAGDNVLFVLNPGPHRKISHSSIWAVGEEALQKAGVPLVEHRVGDCKILCYRD